MIDFTLGMIIGILAIIILLWCLFCPCKEETVEAALPAAEKAAPVKVVEPAPVIPDDLVIIEGIGPKISRLLNEKGIFTFAQLAAADVAFLEQMLRENGLQFAKPHSWPAQAELAAAGKMEELKELQDKLTAGRV